MGNPYTASAAEDRLALVAALRTSPLLRTASIRTLWALVQSAEVEVFEPEDWLLKAHQDHVCWVIIDGTIRVRYDNNDQSVGRVIAGPVVLGESHAMLPEFSEGPSGMSTQALTQVTALRLNTKRLNHQISHNRALWRAVMGGANLEDVHQDVLGFDLNQIKEHLDDNRRAELLVLSPWQGAQLPMTVLQDALGKALSFDFEDDVLVLEPSKETGALTKEAGLDRLKIASQDVATKLDALRPDYDYVMVHHELAQYIGEHVFTEVRLRHHNNVEPLSPENSESPQHHTVILLPKRNKPKPGANPIQRLRALMRPEEEGKRLVNEGQRTMPLAFTTRIRLDIDKLQAQHAPNKSFGSFSPDLRERLSRWGRGVSQRRVGVALGGSGAWGYAHVALLRGLMGGRNPMPIDVVSGASSGAFLGAYFCVDGEDGMKLSVRRGDLGCFDIVVLMSVISSAALQWILDYDLGQWELEDLEVIFMPVCTNLNKGNFKTWVKGPMSLAVRGASAAPGFFSPLMLDGDRLVDGCVTNNVPVSVLVPHADLLIASNAYPWPRRDSHKHWCNGPISRFIRGLNPITRFWDLIDSASLMLHSSGSWQSQAAQVIWNASEVDMPLVGAMLFINASEILENIHEHHTLRKTIAHARILWNQGQPPPAGEHKGQKEAAL